MAQSHLIELSYLRFVYCDDVNVCWLMDREVLEKLPLGSLVKLGLNSIW